jgi:F-type H+-transporting ATPase subunit delta
MAAVTTSYARAFADVVASRKLNAEAVMAELNSLVETLGTSVDLRQVWENPSVPMPQKRALLDAIAQRTGMSRESRNFIAVLIDHRRIPLLSQVVSELRAELNRRMGVVDAEVTSARPLGDDEKRELEERIGRSAGQRVRAQYTTDPALLGGAVVRIGSTIYDGTVKGQLQKLRRELSTT